jgi:thiaminase/transcriptional activator TenA
MTFARMLKASSTTIDRIVKHSYNQELQSKQLPRQVFKAYVEQDVLYLKGMTNALNITSAKLSDSNHKHFISKLIDETVHYEETMLTTYLGTSIPLFQTTTMTDIVQQYTSHLLNCASQPVEVAMASVLPCFWIYSQLGHKMADEGVAQDTTHPYHLWIQSYANQEFFTTTQELQIIVETLGVNSDKHDAMVAAFETSANYELAFYEQTYPHKEPQAQNTLMLRHAGL